MGRSDSRTPLNVVAFVPNLRHVWTCGQKGHLNPSNCVLFCSDDTPVATAKRLPGEGEEERDSSGRLWRTVIIGDQEQRIDMQVIRPYLRVVTHGG